MIFITAFAAAGACMLFGLPLSPFGTVAHLGPHARHVTDAAILMNIITRPDARDWTSLPFDPRDYTVGLNDGVRGLRIACGRPMRRPP